MPKQLKARQLQRAWGPKVDKASPLIVDSRRTRTRWYDGHLPSFHPWKQSCPLMWQSGQVMFHFTSTLAADGQGRKSCLQLISTYRSGLFSAQLRKSSYMHSKVKVPQNIFHMSPAEASIPDWLTPGPTHGWADECRQACSPTRLPVFPVSPQWKNSESYIVCKCKFMGSTKCFSSSKVPVTMATRHLLLVSVEDAGLT